MQQEDTNTEKEGRQNSRRRGTNRRPLVGFSPNVHVIPNGPRTRSSRNQQLNTTGTSNNIYKNRKATPNAVNTRRNSLPSSLDSLCEDSEPESSELTNNSDFSQSSLDNDRKNNSQNQKKVSKKALKDS